MRAYVADVRALHAFLLRAAGSDTEAGSEGLNNVLRAGGLLTLRATFGPATGLAQLAVEVVEPTGQTHQLMQADIERSVLRN